MLERSSSRVTLARLGTAAAAIAIAVSAAACGLVAETGGVIVNADDYAYRSKLSELPAGEMPFTLRNEGTEPHELILARLRDGKTLDDARAARDSAEVVEGLPRRIEAAPGEEASMRVNLTPGRWLMACFLEGSGGKSHAELGMVQTFTVG